MNDKRKEYLKKWREDNKEHISNYKKEYAKTHDSSFKKLQDKYKQLQQENKQLKIQISAREEVCNRLENNWNKLKEIAKSQSWFKKRADLKGGLWFEVDDLLDKMHELEQGSDSNE